MLSKAGFSGEAYRLHASLSEEVAAARGGDEQVLARIIARHMPTIRSVAARLRCPGLDFEDAVQEGLIGLFRAIESFDAEKTASFSTYATVCIQNAVTAAARSAQRKKHAPLNTSLPLEDSQFTPSTEEIWLAEEGYKNTWHHINTRLSVFEKQVLALFLEGQSYRDIAKQLSVPEKAVDNALQRVRGKLK